MKFLNIDFLKERKYFQAEGFSGFKAEPRGAGEDSKNVAITWSRVSGHNFCSKSRLEIAVGISLHVKCSVYA